MQGRQLVPVVPSGQMCVCVRVCVSSAADNWVGCFETSVEGSFNTPVMTQGAKTLLAQPWMMPPLSFNNQVTPLDVHDVKDHPQIKPN